MAQNYGFSRFMVVWSGQLISNIGSGLTAFTLGLFVYQTTESATSYALLMLFSFLPSLLLKPVGGVLADRFDRRLMMITGDLGSAMGLLFILGWLLSGHLALWQIYTGAAISSVFAALQNPAYKASVSDFLPEERFAQASGLMQLAASSQYLVSPVLSGFLFNRIDIKYILLIDMATFFIAVLAVFFVRANQATSLRKVEKPQLFSEMREGFHAITGNKGIVILIAITSVLCFYIGFLQTLFGPMLLHLMDAESFGVTQALCAAGLLVSSLLIGVMGGSERHVSTISLSLFLVGLFYAWIGCSTNRHFIIVSGFLFFFTLPFVQTSLEVLIRRNVDNEKQGRVWSIISLVTQLGYPVAYGLAGPLADDVFNPLLMEQGLLAPTVGRLIGAGTGRGIGLMFIIAGVLVILLAAAISRNRAIRDLEKGEGQGEPFPPAGLGQANT
ncbi:MFS transporter [Heliobacterium undosum]|uniref:MFS transporter n=1 Tax=Heliomicrobium undosum TaxID=121734 RepID=A0A845L5Y9_9FIRM|nr:MFS transporter [Heliomicrobium undosum]MZP29178.1 MFS transporter [Heliomicrobium undosum]